MPKRPKKPKPTREEVQRMFGDVLKVLGDQTLTAEERLAQRLDFVNQQCICWFRKEFPTRNDMPPAEDGFMRIAEMYEDLCQQFSADERLKLLAVTLTHNAVRRLY